MSCLLYSPKNNKSAAAYLHIHGGGYVGGRKEYSDPMNTLIAAKLGVTVLAVGYRLAPEHPVPAPLDDCYSALAWLHDRAAHLGIDSRRIAIGGESAGGGLAAALAIHARDEGKYPVCHQHLTYPMLDHRTGTPEHYGDPLVGEFVWTRESNQFGWSCYLGSHPAQAPHVPAMVSDVKGLPPAWIFTVSLDLFRDENISYAQRLLAAGVDTELVVMPGACHGFQLLPNTSLGKRYVNTHLEALGRALKVS
jgi:acetyl esterase/lipase